MAMVKNVDRLRRGIDEVGIAGVHPVRGEKLANHDPEIHREQDCAGCNGDAVAAQLPPHHAPLRGDIKPFLRCRHPLDGIGIIGRPGDVVRQRHRFSEITGRAVLRPRNKGQIAHC